jgi:RND family efflux transporter MFP subunit
VAGRVLSIAPTFASGGFFEADEVMVTIDPVDYELAVVTARGQVAQAKVRLETENARAEVAREEWADLGEGDASPLATRELQLEEAQAALDGAEALLRQARRNLSRTKVRAPYACRVREKTADVGRYVTPGTPVARIYAIDYAEITLPIADGELAFLDLPVDYRGQSASGKEGPEVILTAEFAGSQREWRGRVVRVGGEIDPMTRMVNVVAQVDDPYTRLEGRTVLPVGLFVNAEIIGRTLEDVFVVPRRALRGEDMILVVDDENRLRFRTVEVLRAGRENVVVGAGLQPGERVCISTIEAVTDGMRVRPLGDERSQDTPATETTTLSSDAEGGSE